MGEGVLRIPNTVRTLSSCRERGEGRKEEHGSGRLAGCVGGVGREQELDVSLIRIHYVNANLVVSYHLLVLPSQCI